MSNFILPSPVRPSWKQGFARSASESASPGLWNGLIGCWAPNLGPTGDRVVDIAGGHDGILTGRTPDTAWVVDRGRYAMDFQTNDYLDTGINLYDRGIRRHATMSAWANVDTLEFMDLFADWNSSLGASVRVDIGGEITFFVYPNNNRITTAALVSSISDWFHVSAVMDGTSMYLYFNGEQVKSGALNDDLGDSAASFRIGIRGDDASDWNGRISETLLHNRALSANEIRGIYNGDSPLQRKRTMAYLPSEAAAADIVGSIFRSPVIRAA